MAHSCQRTKFRENRSRITRDTPFCAFSKMAVAAILNFQKVLFWTPSDTCIALPISISIQKLVQIGRELAEIRPFVYFPRWRPPPSLIPKK